VVERAGGRPVGFLVRVFSRGWARVVLALALAEGVVLVGAPTFLAPALQSTGASVGVAGVVVSAFGVGVLAASRLVKVLVGHLTPASLAAIGGIMIVLGLAPPAITISVTTVLAAGVLLGAGWAFFHSSMQSWATEVVPSARATMVSLFVSAVFVGSAVGTTLVAPLADSDAFERIFQIALVLAAPLAVVTVVAQSRFRPA
jgi:predicted MFS family arabinose efflux permease